MKSLFAAILMFVFIAAAFTSCMDAQPVESTDQDSTTLVVDSIDSTFTIFYTDTIQ